MFYGGQGAKLSRTMKRPNRMRIALDLIRSVFEEASAAGGVTNLQAHLRGLTEFVFGRVLGVCHHHPCPAETDLVSKRSGNQQPGCTALYSAAKSSRNWMLDALQGRARTLCCRPLGRHADMENFVEPT